MTFGRIMLYLLLETLITYKIPHVNDKDGRDSWNEDGDGKDENSKWIFSSIKNGMIMLF